MKNVKSLTSPCGIDCFNCPTYEDNITKELTVYLAGVLKKPEEDVPCKGCRVNNGCTLYNFPCETLNCVKDKEYEFCYECGEFPCSRFNPSAENAEKYPHNLKVYNLCKIKNDGLENWVKEAKDIRDKYFNGKFIPGKGPINK